MSTTTSAKISRSVALDQEVARRAAEEARAQNRSFSNYVETILAATLLQHPKDQEEEDR